jgi:hypothetical protein
MQEAHKAALSKALKLLSAIGASQVYVKTPDGEVVNIGGVFVRETKPKKFVINRKLYEPLNHKAKIEAMQIGDVLEFPLLDGMLIGNLQGTLSSAGSVAFGRGNFMVTRVKKNTAIQCMRLG